MAFNNIFDSSLVDYSNDFEQNDEIYKNKVEYGEKLLTEATADHFVEIFLQDEFDDFLSRFFNEIEDKLDVISKEGYINNAYSDWSYDGIPETAKYYICGKQDKECVKLFGVNLEDPFKDPNCEAYNTVDSNIIHNYIDNKEIKKIIAKQLSNKINEYAFHVIEDSYLDDINN